MNAALVTDGFVRKHDGNAVDDGINQIAAVTMQPLLLRRELYRLFARRTDENVEKFLGNDHKESLPVVEIKLI